MVYMCTVRLYVVHKQRQGVATLRWVFSSYLLNRREFSYFVSTLRLSIFFLMIFTHYSVTVLLAGLLNPDHYCGHQCIVYVAALVMTPDSQCIVYVYVAPLVMTADTQCIV